MKILILATDIYTRGGIARYTWTLASALGDLVGPDNVHVLALVDLGGSKEVPEHFKILDVITEQLTRTAKLRFAAKAVAQARQGYDLVICTHVALAPIGAVLRVVHRTPYWVACHSVEVWRRLSPLLHVSLRLAGRVLPVAQFTAQKLVTVNGIHGSKVRVLYNAISSDFGQFLLAQDGTVGFPRIGGRDESLILSVCSLVKGNEFKGVDMVIQALPDVLSRVPKARYVVVGSGSDRSRLESLAGRMAVSDRVTFLGEISDVELASLYHACSVCVLPIRSQEEFGTWGGEGFGRVYAEAALAGRPVIASRTAGAAEAVVNGETGFLVDPTSLEEITEAILELVQSPELGNKIGAEGKKIASKRFSQEALRNSLRELLGADCLSGEAESRLWKQEEIGEHL